MRAAVQNLEETRIREVAMAGSGRGDVLGFWFGEIDETAPDVVRQAAVDSLLGGEVFHDHGAGMPALRAALAGYTAALHPGQSVCADRIAVNSGGVHALMRAMQALVGPGDDVVAVTPVWPNLTEQPALLGATVRTVALRPPAPDDAAGAWTLDLPALLGAITPSTRLLLVNSPNNPTGWTLDAAEQQAIVAHCRATGTWILADEVYERLYYPCPGLPCAPSFLDVAGPHDRLVVVHSFAKSFLMTGWPLGWLVVPAPGAPDGALRGDLAASHASVFIQRAGLAALCEAPDPTPRLVAHLHTCRATLLPLLRSLPGVQVAAAPGGMYAFLRLHGQPDSVATAKRLVAEAGLGLAPGSIFGAAGQGWLRWCFAAREPWHLEEGADRLRRWLGL